MASSSSYILLCCFTVMVHIAIITFVINSKSCHCQSNNKGKFPAILIFGDSTVDTGNNNFIKTLFKANHRPYGRELPNQVPSGRFSDGRLVPDLLASALGIKEFVPPYLDPSLSDEEILTGVSFASAGSGLDDLTTLVSGVIPMSKQPAHCREYKERLERIAGTEEANKIINNALVLVSVGSNDMLFTYYDTPARWSQFSKSQYQDFLLQKLEGVVQELYHLGCRYFILSGLGPIGCVPIQLTAKFENPLARKCLEDENSDTLRYNTKLERLSHEMQASLAGTTMIYANIYDPVIDMINNPQKYGFVETNKGCCGSGFVEMGPLCNAFTPICSDPSQYIFWDAIHPGEAAYKVVINSLIDTILPP